MASTTPALYQSTFLDSDNTETNEDEVRKILDWFYVVGVIPWATLAFLFNGIAFWVWRTSKKQKAITLLFQALALWDNSFLLFKVASVVCFLQRDMDKAIALNTTCTLFQSLSIHTTLLIAIVRWLAVHKPFLVRRITWRHILIACGLVSVWCALLTGIYGHLLMPWEPLGSWWLVEVVRILLPVLLLMAFSVSLVWGVRQKRTIRANSGNRSSQKTTIAVLCIAGCSCVAYLVTMVGELVFAIKFESDPYSDCWRCRMILMGIASSLQIINSGINFIFYALLASRFRELLRETFCCCAKGGQTSDDIKPDDQELPEGAANNATESRPGGLQSTQL